MFNDMLLQPIELDANKRTSACCVCFKNFLIKKILSILLFFYITGVSKKIIVTLLFIQKLVPTWDALAKTVDSAVTIGKVDCTQHRTLCNEFDVKGYPTLLWINKDNGKSVS